MLMFKMLSLFDFKEIHAFTTYYRSLLSQVVIIKPNVLIKP